MNFKFKKGDIVKFNHPGSMPYAAKKGALARLIGYGKNEKGHKNKYWLNVSWIRADPRVNCQMNGNYYISNFSLATKKDINILIASIV